MDDEAYADRELDELLARAGAEIMAYLDATVDAEARLREIHARAALDRGEVSRDPR